HARAALGANPKIGFLPHVCYQQSFQIFPFSISKGGGMSSAPAPAIINVATVRTVHRRGKSMSRRTGQNGTLEERNGAWRGRFLVDVPGQMERQKRSVVLGFKKEITKSEAKRKLKEIIVQEGKDLPTYVIPSTLSFAQKVELWERTYVAKRKPSTQGLIAYHLTYLLERGGMHGFRHHRVSTLVMAGTPMVVIK